jgi:hypothetical protein
MAFEAGRSLAGSSLMPADIVSFLPARNFTSRVAEPVRPYANYLAGQITSSPQNFSGIVNMSAFTVLFDMTAMRMVVAAMRAGIDPSFAHSDIVKFTASTSANQEISPRK